MSSLISCPGCKHKLTLPRDFIGQRVQCPKCLMEFHAQATATPAMEVDPQAQPEVTPAVESIPQAQPAPLLQTAYASASGALERKPTAASPMVYCIECGTKFAKTEDACPACGCPVQDVRAKEGRENRDPRRRRNLPPINAVIPILAAALLPLGVVVFVASLIAAEGLRAPPLVRFWVSFLIGAVGVVMFLVALVFCVIWLYQAWRIVLSDDEDYSPGLMVGLLFVPFFNIYWIFQVVPGLSSALQRKLNHLAPTRNNSAGWIPGFAACVLAIVPFPPIWAVAVCLFVGWMLLANNAVYRLVRLHGQTSRDQATPNA